MHILIILFGWFFIFIYVYFSCLYLEYLLAWHFQQAVNRSWVDPSAFPICEQIWNAFLMDLGWILLGLWMLICRNMFLGSFVVEFVSWGLTKMYFTKVLDKMLVERVNSRCWWREWIPASMYWTFIEYNIIWNLKVKSTGGNIIFWHEIGWYQCYQNQIIFAKNGQFGCFTRVAGSNQWSKPEMEGFVLNQLIPILIHTPMHGMTKIPPLLPLPPLKKKP